MSEVNEQFGASPIEPMIKLQMELRRAKDQVEWLKQIDAERDGDFRLHADSLKAKCAELEQVKAERDAWKEKEFAACSKHHEFMDELSAKNKVLEEVAYVSIPPGKEGRVLHVLNISARAILSQYKGDTHE